MGNNRQVKEIHTPPNESFHNCHEQRRQQPQNMSVTNLSFLIRLTKSFTSSGV